MESLLKIDIDKILINIKNYKKQMLFGQKFCAVVKADCYGLGVKKIAYEIEEVVDYFAVSSKKEFLELRKIVTKPILILDPIYKNITILAKKCCEFCVSNFYQLDKIILLSKKNKSVVYKIHIAFNTGMNRFGFQDYKDVLLVFELIKKVQNIVVIGIFSHFYLGNNEETVKIQSHKLNQLKSILSLNFDVSKIIFHISNTEGFKNEKRFDMIRIGLGLFVCNNKSCFSLESKIIEIQEIKKHDTAGYGLRFIAEKDMKLAVVSIGYADGIPRAIAGSGFVLVNGKFAKVIAVCMDSIIIDISLIDAKICDDVVIIGKSGDNNIFVCDVASWCGTIEYEIMTRVSKRVKRVYIGGIRDAGNNWKIQSKKTDSC